MRIKSITIRIMHLVIAAATLFLFSARIMAAETVAPLELQPLIQEALKNNHEVWVAEAKWKGSASRVKLAGSLPDPMVMIGYQNEGWSKYSYGKTEGAQWIYGVSQMFPFPGKRALKEEMAARDADTAAAMHRAAQLGTVARVKELYFDLLQAYKELDLVRERASLFSRIEEAALARYATGMGQQQEVLMAQTEKYMLLEREAMLKQKRQAVEAMLTATVGREGGTPFGRPVELPATPFFASGDDLIRQALENSPEVRSREKMLSASQAGVHMAEKEYYPDVTLAGTVLKRSGDFQDMWALTATFNIPLYFKSRQDQALASARAMSSAAIHDLAGIKAMLTASVRDNYSMVRSAEQLMDLYRTGLIPKTNQDFEQSLTSYRNGKIEEITVVSRLKSLLEYETSYWTQFVAREKAIARIEALTGTDDQAAAQGDDHDQQEQK
ncbi:MAG: TolC family protein [Nitrospirae bacterium]|nr:TolC family protein [Nitrospirota bacterium]